MAKTTSSKSKSHSSSKLGSEPSQKSGQSIPVNRSWDKKGAAHVSYVREDVSESMNRWLEEPAELGPYNTIAEISEMNGPSPKVGSGSESVGATHGSKKHSSHKHQKKL